MQISRKGWFPFLIRIQLVLTSPKFPSESMYHWRYLPVHEFDQNFKRGNRERETWIKLTENFWETSLKHYFNYNHFKNVTQVLTLSQKWHMTLHISNGRKVAKLEPKYKIYESTNAELFRCDKKTVEAKWICSSLIQFKNC